MQTADVARGRIRPGAVVGVLTALLAIRLLRFAWRISADLPIDDEWDLVDHVVFSTGGWWPSFAWQHGPHRQGLGGLALVAVYRWAHLDTRVEALVAALCAVGACLAALAIARKALGKITWSDAAIPLAYLTLLQWQLYAGAQNLAHGPFPTLLVAAAGLTLGVERLEARLILLVGLVGCCMFTGFALFASPLLAGFMALDLWHTRGERHRRLARIGALVASLAIMALFFVGYRVRRRAQCPTPDAMRIDEVLAYPALMLGRALGAVSWHTLQSGAVAWLLPIVAYLVLVGVFVIALLRAVRRESEYRDRAIAFLAGFTLVFGVATTAGRICLGIGSSQASRYVIYHSAGILAIYLAARGWLRPIEAKPALLAGFVTLLALKELRVRADLPDIERVRAGKTRWASCYLERKEIAACNQLSGLRIHPNPRRLHIPENLARMEKERLSFFRTR